MEDPPRRKKPLSARPLAASQNNIREAHKANRQNYQFTPARRAALDRARKKLKYLMTPAKQAALWKAQEANRRNYRLTPARLTAMRRSIRKAQAASVLKFRWTPAREAANRVNIRKARAAARTPESYRRSRHNALKDGLTVGSVEETLRLLKEDPKEYQEFHRLLARLLAPQEEEETALVRRLGDTIWRRLRLYQAQARWEKEQLLTLMRSAPASKHLDADLTRLRAFAIFEALYTYDNFYRHAFQSQTQVELLLRELLSRRTGGNPDFKIFTREARKEMEDVDEQAREARVLERLEAGGQEVEAILDKFRPEWVREKLAREGNE